MTTFPETPPIEYNQANAKSSSADFYTNSINNYSIVNKGVDDSIELFGTTPTIDCDSGNNKKFKITLTASTTFSVVNAVKGCVFIVKVKQGVGTSFTNTWFGGINWITSGGTAPVQTTTSNGVSTYGFICMSTDVYDGYLVGKS